MAEGPMMQCVKGRLETLGYTADETDETALAFLIEKVLDEILTFCNIEDLPASLEPFAADRVCGQYLQQLQATGKLKDYAFERVVKSITEGDSSFTFADDKSGATAFSEYLASLASAGDAQLLAFRKLRW